MSRILFTGGGRGLLLGGVCSGGVLLLGVAAPGGCLLPGGSAPGGVSGLGCVALCYGLLVWWPSGLVAFWLKVAFWLRVAFWFGGLLVWWPSG